MMNRIALALVLILAAPSYSLQPMKVERLKVGGVEVKNMTIDPSQTKVCDPVNVGDTQIQGWEWAAVPVSGNPSVNVIITQSNYPEGPFTEWSSPADGSTPTTNVTVTTSRGGSPWKWTPSRWVQYRLRNSAAVAVNVTVDSVCQ